MINWDRRFLDLAFVISRWSKDPNTKVGSVIVKDKFILSTGYNGFPRGLSDDLLLLKDRGRKNMRMVHAEANAILTAARHGVSCRGSTLYTTLNPCAACATFISQSGIVRLVTLDTPVRDDHWRDSFREGKLILEESKVEYCCI